MLSPLIKREGAGRAMPGFEGRSLSPLEFIYMITEEMEDDFWPESIFSWFPCQFVIATFHSLGLNLCLAFTYCKR